MVHLLEVSGVGTTQSVPVPLSLSLFAYLDPHFVVLRFTLGRVVFMCIHGVYIGKTICGSYDQDKLKMGPGR